MIHLELSYSRARVGWGGVMLDQKLQVSVFLWIPNLKVWTIDVPNSITSFCINFFVSSKSKFRDHCDSLISKLRFNMQTTTLK